MPMLSEDAVQHPSSTGFYYDDLLAFLEAGCRFYADASPRVSAWFDDLYQRVQSDMAQVTLAEVNGAGLLYQDASWLQPNYAQNQIYKLLDRLGRSTEGWADF